MTLGHKDSRCIYLLSKEEIEDKRNRIEETRNFQMQIIFIYILYLMDVLKLCGGGRCDAEGCLNIHS